MSLDNLTEGRLEFNKLQRSLMPTYLKTAAYFMFTFVSAAATGLALNHDMPNYGALFGFGIISNGLMVLYSLNKAGQISQRMSELEHTISNYNSPQS